MVSAVPLRDFHLPQLSEPPRTETRHHDGIDIEHAQLQPAELGAALGAARGAAATLRRCSTSAVLARLDAFVELWADEAYAPRRLAERTLPSVTGFSPETIRHGLPALLEPLRGGAIGALLGEELGSVRFLDEVYRGCRAHLPSLMTHVLSGNIPGFAATAMLLSLAMRGAVLVKSAVGDPLLPAMFASSLAEEDAELGACVVVAHWRGGDRLLEDVAFAGSDFVSASGSDAAVAAVAARVRGRFAGYGHKVSFAFVGRGCLSDMRSAEHWADRLAYDTSLWDQQGCLSPQLCYVEDGARVKAADFGRLVGEAMSRWARRLPPRRLSVEEQAAVLRFREEALWSAAASGSGAPEVFSSEDSLAWSIRVEPGSDFLPTCLNRCLRVKAVAGVEQLRQVLAPHRRFLEAAGIAVDPTRRAAVVDVLSGCGVHRICPLGRMQHPPLSWRQGGRPRIADWVQWTSVEDTEGDA
jgi:hypothetical protein